MIKPNIAIDGPAAGGKTTVAKLLAQNLGILYLDTGAMYRAVAYQARQVGLNFSDDKALTNLAENMDMSLELDLSSPAGHKLFVDKVDITSFLHRPEVDQDVAVVAAIPGVRRDMVRRQRLIAQGGGIVMAGRDIGSVVLPQAQLKYYLEASLEVRAKRRFEELQLSGRQVPFEEVRADMVRRDLTDAQRSDSPMCVAPGAKVIDCSTISAEDVAQIIESDYAQVLSKS